MIKKKEPKLSRAGSKIVAGLKEIAEALESGQPLSQRFTVRHVTVPEPGHYKARDIKMLRARLGVSQRLFAELIGVSVILEQAWEHGDIPSTTARRLLDEIERDPKRWSSMLEPAKAA